MRGFDAAISKVPQPYFTALSFQARNLVTGRNVAEPQGPVATSWRS